MTRIARIFTGLVALTLSLSTLSPSVGQAAAPGHDLRITHDARAQQLSVSVRWPAPRVERDAKGDVLLSIDGLPSTVDAGLPAVPVRTIKVALPRGARLKDVRVAEPVVHALAGRVRASRSMRTYSWETMDRAALRSADAPRIPAAGWPERRVQTSVQVLHHVPVVYVNVYPVVVSAAGDSASVASDAQVTVSYETDPANRSLRGMTGYEAAQVAALVDNPQDVAAAPLGDPGEGDAYDYLILSSAELIGYAGPGGFKDLTDDLAKRSLKARVVDVATAAAAAPGKDTAEKLRNFIKAQYEKSKIRYVLLAADGDAYGAGNVIPVRRFHQKLHTYDGSWHWIENDIPCDLYYSCLDADFDGNGNGVYGEANDGANGGDVDLLAEVVVGRMPMKTPSELKAFVTKTIAYAASARPKSTLLMGEALFPEMNLYGDDYMNQLVGACSDHGYTTNGYTADWTVAHLYDREHSWSGSAAIAKINGGNFSAIHHLGHSSTDYNMRMSSRSIKKLTNAEPFFYYTQGCFPGDFTEDACFIEVMMRAEKAAVAAVANTCYGLGPEDPQPTTTTTPGASQMLHRRFVDALESGAADTLARANQASKEAFLGLASAAEIRWVMWDAHYFGDPSLKAPR